MSRRDMTNESGGETGRRAGNSAEYDRDYGPGMSGVPAGAPMMHVPPQAPSAGQDAEIYSMVRGGAPGASFDGKRTYYAPWPKILFRIVCLILIPAILIGVAATFIKNRYFATHGNFEITAYNIDNASSKYSLRSRDTKRFAITRVETTTLVNGKEVKAVWEGYYLEQLLSVTKFGKDSKNKYDYFMFVGEDKDGNALPVAGQSYGPRLEHYMVLVFKIEGGQRKDIYGNTIPNNTQPAGFLIMEPESHDVKDMYYNVTEIRLGLKAKN